MAKWEFSKEMLEAIEAMKAGPFLRFPGGYWAREGWSIRSEKYYSGRTIQALVDRGRAEYTEFKNGFNGRLAIKAELKK